MLKREVREMVKYLVGERKSFKVVFANNEEATVEYKGFCWVINGKAFSDEELVEKMVRFQNNEKKFIVKFEEVEEVEEVVEEVVEVKENEEAQEAEIEEEVENLNNDLFQEEDIQYCEEAIERESEVDKQIKDLSTLVGKKVFVKRNSLNGYTYKDSEKVETFTLDDLEYYTEGLIEGEIELQDIEYTNMFKEYYLITFNDLQYVC